MVNMLKIYNNFHSTAMELMMKKDFSFLVHKKQNYTDYVLNDYFFSDIYGEYYKIPRYSNKKVYIYNSFNFSKPIPKSHPPWNFSHKSVGVRIGKYFWIIGGHVNCLTYNLGTYLHLFKHKVSIEIL